MCFFFAFWKNNEVREVLDLSLNFLQYDFCVNIRHYTEILYFLMIRVCCWHLHYFQTFYKYISPDHHYKSTVDGDQGVDFFLQISEPRTRWIKLSSRPWSKYFVKFIQKQQF